MLLRQQGSDDAYDVHTSLTRHADIRDQNPSLGLTCPGEPHQRSPNAPKFEDRSQEETERQERDAREAACKLVSEHDEISGMETTGWENHSWKYLSLIGDERVINLKRIKVYVFSDSVLCLGKIHENPESNGAWEDRLGWFETSQEYRNFDRIDGEAMKFEWNISQDSLRCSSVKKSKVYC